MHTTAAHLPAAQNLGEQVASWFAHAAVWQIVRHQPLAVLPVIAALGIGVMWWSRRSRSRR